MERAKLANGNGNPSSVRQAPARDGKNQKHAARSKGETALRKKAQSANSKPGSPLRTVTGRKPTAEKLVCRYCGSDDLAPSFIKRRDRRCRKCFSRRYGSAARAKKAKVKK